MKEYLTIALFYFILFLKNTMPYVQKAFIITWVYSKLFWGNAYLSSNNIKPGVTFTWLLLFLVLVPCKWVGKGTINVKQFLYLE
jgi:hypothetical protein